VVCLAARKFVEEIKLTSRPVRCSRTGGHKFKGKFNCKEPAGRRRYERQRQRRPPQKKKQAAATKSTAASKAGAACLRQAGKQRPYQTRGGA